MGDALLRRRKLNDDHFYKNGNMYSGITGGWSASGYTAKTSVGSSYTVVAPTINANNIYIAGGSGCGVAGTQLAIDVTKYSKIYIRYNNAAVATYGLIMCAATTKFTSNTVYSTVVASLQLKAAAGTETTASMDVSSISGSVYLSVNALGSRAGYVYEIWPEE